MDNNQIKTIIKEYIALDDEINEHNKSLKDKKKMKTDLEDKITDYMLANDLAKVDIGDAGALEIDKKAPAKKINKKTIISDLLEILQQEQVDEIVNHIFPETPAEEDESEVVAKLKRKSKKTKKTVSPSKK